MSATSGTAWDLVAAHRGKLKVAAALLALVAVGSALRSFGRDGLVRFFYGRGYVPWVLPEWKAKQAASKLGRPLARLIVDARHPAASRLEELAKAREVELLLEGFVWYREAIPPAEGDASAPVLVVRTPDGERELAGPWTIETTLGAPLLVEWLRSARAAHEQDSGS